MSVFHPLPLFYPYLPIIRLSSPHLLLPTPSFSLCVFSLIHVSLPSINQSYNLYSVTLSFPVPRSSPLFTFCICHCHPLSGFYSSFVQMSTLCHIQPILPLLSSPYTSISASISGARTADGGGPLSPLREQKVCPLPLRLCVMEHREIETEEREQMGGGHTGCLFYNITPNNAVVIRTTM